MNEESKTYTEATEVNIIAWLRGRGDADYDYHYTITVNAGETIEEAARRLGIRGRVYLW